MKRLSDEVLKRNGFKKINSMQAFQKDGVIVSYGLIVAIGTTSADGYHNYSQTTSKQVSKATGDYSEQRKKNWNIVSSEEFETMANKIISSMR